MLAALELRSLSASEDTAMDRGGGKEIDATSFGIRNKELEFYCKAVGNEVRCSVQVQIPLPLKEEES